MEQKKQDSLPENRRKEDLKLVNGHVYRQTTPQQYARVASQSARERIYVFSVHIVAATKSRGARITGADPGHLCEDGRELSFVININGGANR